ncbi:hypothetical protein L195_g062804, partial [Trifolium pratense]
MDSVNSASTPSVPPSSPLVEPVDHILTLNPDVQENPLNQMVAED